MDQIDYNNQAIDWHTFKHGDVISSMIYHVPHADVLSYMTEAMRDPNPFYQEKSPLGGPFVPPGYFYGEYLRILTQANLPMGALNAKLSFQSKGVISHGEKVTVVGTIDKFYEKRGRPYMDMAVVVKNKDDVVVLKGLVTLLLKL